MKRKGKLEKFEELKSFTNVFQFKFEEITNDFPLKGKWAKDYFKNDNPVILELGCGKGEYTLGLARQFPDKNFIGVDIKGNRIWKGSKIALNEGLSNVAFVRVYIDHIESFFGKDEISEIWLTFPDPQMKRKNKRLSSPRFLSKYKNLLVDGGIIHLKTDSLELFDYTLEVIKENHYELIASTYDLYNDINNIGLDITSILSIKTFYEEMFLKEGKKTNYLKFKLHR